MKKTVYSLDQRGTYIQKIDILKLKYIVVYPKLYYLEKYSYVNKSALIDVTKNIAESVKCSYSYVYETFHVYVRHRHNRIS